MRSIHIDLNGLNEEAVNTRCPNRSKLRGVWILEMCERLHRLEKWSRFRRGHDSA